MSPRTFKRILIANRGEIALRVMRTSRAMGIATVAVYSVADLHSPHTRFADEAVYIGASPSSESYLNIERVLDAARRTQSDAIHPGYGFLSESSIFARACLDAGVIFIGPSPEIMGRMGDKTVARSMAEAAGLPILPGYDGKDQSPEALRDAILALGLPVMIKAAAGGGGKGMRVVRDVGEIGPAIAAAEREASRAFGDGRLFVEKLVERARHIEVQILGDQHGNLVHLFERDCSLQRRHQKIIEESPAPGLPTELRDRLCQLAVALGRSIGYDNAGTVEFLVTPTGEVFFIEVNTRLQVEHPVTEMVTGLDLVRLQIGVAEGRVLPISQAEIHSTGHAIEARLYAENPANGFLPATGTVKDWIVANAIDGMRVESGVERGVDVGIHYDPLLAKFIAHGSDRDGALRKLVYGLRHSLLHGVSTNRDFLICLLAHREVCEGKVETEFIEKHLPELIGDAGEGHRELAAVVVAVHLGRSWRAENALTSRLPASYRNSPYRLPSVSLEVLGETCEVSWQDTGDDRINVFVGELKFVVRALDCSAREARLEIGGVQHTFRILRDQETYFVSSTLGDWRVVRLPRFPIRQRDSDLEMANAPMPGQVLKILIETGQYVEVGEALVILEAMKMEQTVRASVAGVVEAILVSPGALVSPGDLLVRITGVEEPKE